MSGCRYALPSFEGSDADMSFIYKHKGKMIAVICVITVLTIAFFCGGDHSSTTPRQTINDRTEMASQLKDAPACTLETQDNATTQEAKTSTASESLKGNAETGDMKDSEDNKAAINHKTSVDENKTEIVSADKPVPVEPEETEVIQDELTCTLSVRCDTAVGKLSEKADVIPDNGVILKEQTVVFYEGETVFHVLVRELKKNQIHLEFVNVPIYNSAYIEGIDNLYEFDCGELSGWMYKVNNWFPNYGCSQYQLKAGDKIEWIYTCDLGNDVGGQYSARNGN